jgi:aminoglycoside 2'-N-acetyltransferase I
VSVRKVSSPELTRHELEVLRELFVEVWPDQRFDEHDWDHALGGRHFIVEYEGAIAAHASVVRRIIEAGGVPLDTGYVEAVATRPQLQRRGFGTQVMRAASGHIRDRFALGALDTSSQGFYERLGWERWRGPTSVRTADALRRTDEEDGYVMVLRTPRTPASLDPDAPISCDWREGDVW